MAGPLTPGSPGPTAIVLNRAAGPRVSPTARALLTVEEVQGSRTLRTLRTGQEAQGSHTVRTLRTVQEARGSRTPHGPSTVVVEAQDSPTPRGLSTAAVGRVPLMAGGLLTGAEGRARLAAAMLRTTRGEAPHMPRKAEAALSSTGIRGLAVSGPRAPVPLARAGVVLRPWSPTCPAGPRPSRVAPLRSRNPRAAH